MFKLPRSLDPQVAPTAEAQCLQGSQAVYTTQCPGWLPSQVVVSLRIRHEQLMRLDFHQLDCSLVGCSSLRVSQEQFCTTMPLLPRSGPLEQCSPTSSVLLRHYDFLRRIRSHLWFRFPAPTFDSFVCSHRGRVFRVSLVPFLSLVPSAT